MTKEYEVSHGDVESPESRFGWSGLIDVDWGVIMPVPSGGPETKAPRTLLKDTVLARLREAILDGTFEPGERLYDDQIEEWLGVSRTPVRDAVNELARAGLVEMAPNRYTRVAIPRDEDVVHALQTLGVLLGGVVRSAVPVLAPERRKALQEEFAAQAAQLRKGETAAVDRASVALWRSIARDSGNPLLAHLCEQTIDGLAFRLRAPSAAARLDPDAHAALYETLGERIAAGDATGAEAAVSALHLLPTGDGSPVAP